MTPDTRAHLEALVGCDSTCATSNLAVLDHVAEVLDGHGIAHQRFPTADGTRANLVARIGPDVPGGVVLTGHTDCVPVTGQPWTVDPFAVTEDDGRLYGRGVTDMKGFLATVLAAVPAAAAADLQRPLLLVLTYDEELGTVGAPAAVEALLATQPRPEAVIVGEPTGLEVVTAHKGVRSFTTTVTGVDGHSSQPHRAANAVAALVRIATYIDDLATEHAVAVTDDRFDPPHTTFNLATLTGGQAVNIVPREAELAWEYRPVPADDGEELLDRVRRFADDEVLPRLRASLDRGEVTFDAKAVARALTAEEDGVAEALARTLTGYDGPARTVPFATDGGHFQAAGLSTVVCGPGWIEQAHQPDEHIDVAQLTAGEAALTRLLGQLTRAEQPVMPR